MFTGLIEKNDNTPDSLKKKMMTLVLQAKKKELCKDGKSRKSIFLSPGSRNVCCIQISNAGN